MKRTTTYFAKSDTIVLVLGADIIGSVSMRYCLNVGFLITDTARVVVWGMRLGNN